MCFTPTYTPSPENFLRRVNDSYCSIPNHEQHAKCQCEGLLRKPLDSEMLSPSAVKKPGTKMLLPWAGTLVLGVAAVCLRFVLQPYLESGSDYGILFLAVVFDAAFFGL